MKVYQYPTIVKEMQKLVLENNIKKNKINQ